MNSNEVIQPVQEIIANVQENKDKALHDYTLKFDKADITDLMVPVETIKDSVNHISPKLRQALEDAAENISKFHKAQIPSDWTMTVKDGVKAGQIIRPLERVGCYIPGGRAAYPSSILMTVIPAKIAGVKEIICCTPPDKDGNISNEILAAAYIAGADKIYKVGGAQAIAAMAYSTETIPSVDKIVGPGNIFVATAKKLVYGDVDIEFPAGPSEMLALVDHTANPSYMATELLSQAEHDPNAATIMVSTSREVAEETVKYVKQYLEEQERKEIIEESLTKYSHILVADNMQDAIDFTNAYAPEHLVIVTEDYYKTLESINNAGSIFLGNLTPVAGGDYGSGTNHVLPTSGGARMYSGLSADSFIKKPTIQELSPEGVMNIKDMVVNLAEAEGLYAHALSIKKRAEDIE
ncbi:histidinol dehydrogenase [Candidatus Methanosphaera massiliense]|uniref:histidinol dehydrogenase n=1 Tax=Methanosphaera TaxID=2316 RepID=UPI00238078AB|nr:histidinol dehydrogenase [Candidatus Methanosphaera massiliense]MDE4078087.1 histidinol dehydrogenase [Candidatus Methanosphaera massiliense]